MKKLILITYLISWSLFIVLFLIQEVPLSILFSQTVLLALHALFIVILIPTYLIRYIIIAIKEKRVLLALKRIALRFLLPLGLIVFGIKGIVNYNQSEDFNYTWDYSVERTEDKVSDQFDADGKLRGLSAYALGRDRQIRLNNLVKSNVEWIAVHPYMSQLAETSHDQMSQPDKVGQWSKRDSAFIEEIGKAKAKNFRIMLKPHLWVNEGWRANIHFDSKEDWKIWFASYKANMLHYAHMAELTGVELFCIGTELRSSIKEQGNEWLKLIHEIREIYSGKLTYASNWDDVALYTDSEFWKALDYIGIQAYYPLTDHEYPDLDAIKLGWGQHIKELEIIYQAHHKPILFTELGYRADARATVEPWAWDSFLSPLLKKKSEETQLLAYEAFFQEVWSQPWLAGVFIWQWSDSQDFAIRGKPAQNTMAKWYAKSE